MRALSILIAIAVTIAYPSIASAQEAGYEIPRQEHVVLQRLAGEWQFERLSVPMNDADPQRLGAGVITAEMVGDFFVVSRWSGTVYGMDYTAVQTLGYDIDRKAYSGYWIDSFISFCWELRGTVDEQSRELSISTRGPAPTGGSTNFRERYQFNSPDSITIIGEMQQDEKWIPLSTTRLTRKR